MDAEYTVIDNRQWRYFFRQLFVCMTVTTFYFMIGLLLGAPTVTVPQLRREANSTLAVSDAMASWITSILAYAAMFWIIVLIICTHRFGRKKPMIVTAANALCGFIILYFSKNINHVFISQLVQGLTNATFATTSYLVALEYTSPRYRGRFMGVFTATFFWGMLVANAIGTFFNYRNIALLGIACAIFNFIALLFIPESPYWLAFKGQYDECTRVHRWLKGQDDEAEKELNELIKLQKESKQTVIKIKKSYIAYINKYTKLLKEPEIYKPILLNILLTIAYQLSGKLICAVYALEIMKKVTETELQAYIGILILDSFTVAGMYGGSYLTGVMKRRTLFIGASTIAALFLFLMSIYVYLNHLSILSENYIISIALLGGFSLSACCGPVIISITLCAELYPIKHRSFFMCLACLATKLLIGTSLKTGPYIFEGFHVYGAFLFFAISLSVCIVLVYKYVPETKDKTIQEISAYFRHNKTECTYELKPLQSCATKLET